MNFSLPQLDAKKVLLLVLFLAVCLGLGFGVYWLFFKPEGGVPAEGYPVGTGGLPTTGAGLGGSLYTGTGQLPTGGAAGGQGVLTGPAEKIAQGGNTSVLPITKEKTKGMIISADGNGINFYNTSDNKFYTISNDGQTRLPLSNQEFFGIEDVYWSNDKSQAIIAYPDGNKILYDFSRDKQVTLSPEIEEPEFSSYNEVAYKFVTENEEDNWLAVSRPDGSGTQLVEPLGDQADNVQVAWSPTNEVVGLYAKPTGLDSSEVYFIGLQGENYLSLNVDGTNFRGQWSPSGEKLLYQVVSDANNYNPQLWIVDARGDNIGQHKYNLGLSTFVDKCIFSEETTVYCAVPRSLPTGAGLYPEIVSGEADLIYKIDLTTGRSELLANPVLGGENKFHIQTLHLSDDKRFLFFWDKDTEQVYRLQVK